jgi:hypothetical protein
MINFLDWINLREDGSATSGASAVASGSSPAPASTSTSTSISAEPLNGSEGSNGSSSNDSGSKDHNTDQSGTTTKDIAKVPHRLGTCCLPYSFYNYVKNKKKRKKKNKKV